MSQIDLADEMDVSLKTIEKIEDGKGEVSFSIADLAIALSTDVHSLFEEIRYKDHAIKEGYPKRLKFYERINKAHFVYDVVTSPSKVVQVIITFKNEKFEKCIYQFKNIYSREEWSVLSQIEAEIARIEKEFESSPVKEIPVMRNRIEYADESV